MFRVWYSTESFADWVIDNTILSHRQNVQKCALAESDASKPGTFHKIPDHLKKILYLDAPDIIIEFNNEPILSIEESKEAGTGHNPFQRFSRLVAAVENNVPSFYIYPESKIISRAAGLRWDSMNPLIFRALEEIMRTYNIPAFLYYFPTDYRRFFEHPEDSLNIRTQGIRFNADRRYRGCPVADDPQMIELFSSIDLIVNQVENEGLQSLNNILNEQRVFRDKRHWMIEEYNRKGGGLNWSPLTSTIELPTRYLLNYLSSYNNRVYNILDSELLAGRETTVFYHTESKYRSQGDPFTGCLAAIDYIKCRTGRTFENRDKNLVMVWGNLVVDEENETFLIERGEPTGCSISEFTRQAENGERNSLLLQGYDNIQSHEIPRYYMHVRYGSTYSKSKPIRIFSYFADAIIFPDGALWRDA
ncbi:hypothetical protein [uncultured Alistipes sp.]|jgi:hypothetical protein|uniref:hypothetical protein n=1 Tax=uncultured Alistipes sp. TaxID=538949 RepID=UPI0025DF5D8B|nr:hypothetical protein [uncultured Alistipes sp.]